jgi:hypothetical protein
MRVLFRTCVIMSHLLVHHRHNHATMHLEAQLDGR